MKFVQLLVIINEAKMHKGVCVAMFCVSQLFCILSVINFMTFVGSVAGNPHETITHPLGPPRGLKACCIC